jgi:TonB family protein
MSSLIDGALKVSFILLVALGVCVLLRARSAALRHWVLAVAIACALATPLLSAVITPWLRVPSWRGSVAPGARQAWPTGVGAPSDTPTAADTAVRTEFSTVDDRDEGAASASVRRVALGVWLAGSVVSFFVLVAGLGRLGWLASRARGVSRGRWFALAEEVGRSYALSTPVRFLQSDHPSLLVTWGWRRPKVILPVAAREWSEDRRRVVLTHELAHIQRGDWVVQLAAEVLRSVYWFNPLLWIVCRRLRVESEHACDDAVLARGLDGPEYAAHLLALAQSLNLGRRPWLPAPAMARPSSLEGRITAMLDSTTNRRPVSRAVRVASVAASLAMTVSIAGLGAQATFYSLTGTVQDQTNRVLPDATLVLTDSTSTAKHEVRTDSNGRFEFVGLPPARYTLEASQPGFAKHKEDLVIEGNTKRDLSLQIGSVQETITVADRSDPEPAPDPARLQKIEESLKRFAEFEQQVKAKCAAGAGPVGGNILAPRKLRDVRPVYPDHLKAAKVGGTVTLEALIGTDGVVRDVREVKGPHPDLEAAAADAVRQWLFSTTLLNCEPIEVRMKVTINFTVRP